MVIWYIFPVLVCYTKKNLATLICWRRGSVDNIPLKISDLVATVFGKAAFGATS
jgi:hypothetical protein